MAAVLIFLVPALLLLLPIVMWSCARDNRKRRAYVAQMNENRERAIAQQIADGKAAQDREKARQRKMLEHFAQFGTSGYRIDN